MGRVIHAPPKLGDFRAARSNRTDPRRESRHGLDGSLEGDESETEWADLPVHRRRGRHHVIAFKGGRVSSGGRRTGLGENASGLVTYLVQGKEGVGRRRSCCRSVWGHQVPTDDPWMFVAFFERTARQNRRCQLPVYHVGASAAPGEELSDDEWSEVGEGMLRSLGLEEHEALFVVHDGNYPVEYGSDEPGSDDETGQQHLHIVVNRVADDGSVWQPSWDYPKLQTAMRQAEWQHGLRKVPSSFEPDQARHLPRLSDAAVCRSRAEGTQPLVDRFRGLGAEHLRDAESWTDLDGRLQPLGLVVRPARRGGGVLVVDAEGHEVSVSKLGRLSGPKLTRRFGIDLRTHRIQSPEPELEAAVPVDESDAQDSTDVVLAEALKTLGEEHGVFRDRDIRRQVRWHSDGVQLFGQLTEHPELVSLGSRDGERLWTTQAYRETERQLWASAARLHSDQDRALSAELVRLKQADDFVYFSSEQKHAVLRATEGRRLTLLQRLSGTEKASMVQAVARSFEASGYRVAVAAHSGRAADLLGEETGIESRTLASWTAQWSQGREGLDERTVLLVDEAGLVGVAQMQRLLERVEAAGASVILLGDPAQQRPIEPGDAFRGLLQLCSSGELADVRRPRQRWQRTASKALACGDANVALQAYAARGFVDEVATRQNALQKIVEHLVELPDDETQLVIAFQQSDVADLNERIRSKRLAHVPPPLRVETEIRGLRFVEGDRVLFRRNESRSVRTLRSPGESAGPERGVRSGTLGTVTTLRDFEMTVELDSGRSVAFSPHEYTDLDYGDAVTPEAARIAAVDHSIVYADDRVDLQSLYVAGTRHRDSLRVVYDRETFADLDELVPGVSREPEPSLVLDCAQPATSPEADRLLARMGSWRATWTRTSLEGVCQDQGLVAEVLRHPDVILLEPDRFTTRRQVLAEARLMEVAERMRRLSCLEVRLHGPSSVDLGKWLEERQIEGRKLLVSADRAGAADLHERLGVRAIVARELVEKPGALPRGCTVIIDRAQLLDTETLVDVLDAVREAGGYVVVSGDPGGHTPIVPGSGAGDGFALLVDRHAASEWQEQLDAKPEQKLAETIRGLDAAGRLSRSEDPVGSVARGYVEANRGHLIATLRDTVRRLNLEVQRLRHERGELGTIRQAHGERFARGDRVVLRVGSHERHPFLDIDGKPAGRVEPGTRGVILRTHPKASLVELDDGRRITLPTKYQFLDLDYARSLRDVASQSLGGPVHAVLDGGFGRRATRALLQVAQATGGDGAELHFHVSSEVHPDLASVIQHVQGHGPRDLAHDQASAVRRYRQLAGDGPGLSVVRDFQERIVGGAAGETRADLLKVLGAPEWSKVYASLDQPTADSWTDWRLRRQMLAETRSAEVSTRALEDLQDHVDGLIPEKSQSWLQKAAWREIQSLAPGKLSMVLGLTRAVTAVARDPEFLLRLVQPRALRWLRIALRVAELGRASRARERARERDGGIEL